MPSQTSWWKTLRELFWPRLEGEASQNQSAGASPALTLSDDCLDKAFELQLKLFDAEDERRKGIESKAALFIGTISVTSSVVVGASALLITNNAYSLQIKLSVLLSCVLSIYTVRTVWYSVKALERRVYANLGFDDIGNGFNKNDYLKKLIVTVEKAVRINQDATNAKMDFLTLAQEYYKRAIAVISVYTFAILLLCFVGGARVPAPLATPVIAPAVAPAAPKVSKTDSGKRVILAPSNSDTIPDKAGRAQSK
jgi:hypothetical protein